MFLRQLQLIVAALTCSLSTICAYLYQVSLLKGVAIIGLLWSAYACYKIFSFNFTSNLPSEPLGEEDGSKAPTVEIASDKEPEMFPSNQVAPNNINKKPDFAFKKEPMISKNLKKSSKI